jgi:hypothetical protein
MFSLISWWINFYKVFYICKCIQSYTFTISILILDTNTKYFFWLGNFPAILHCISNVLDIQWVWIGAPSGVCVWSHCTLWWWFSWITYFRKILWLQTSTSNNRNWKSNVLGLQIRCLCTEEGIFRKPHNRYIFWLSKVIFYQASWHHISKDGNI